MPDGRIRVLLVIGHLGQGGSERFVYEFAKALDRSRFDLEILTKRRPRDIDVYEGMLEALGIRLHRKLPILLHHTRRVAGPLYKFWPIRALVDLPHRIHARFTMGRLLDDFDVIYVVQIENYYLIQPLVRDNSRLITHLMSSAFQYRVNPYGCCRPDRDYRFITYDPTQRADYARSAARNARATMFPNALSLTGRADLSDAIRTKPPFRIGVFQRLHRERQFSELFQTFRAIAAHTDAELIVYGRGDATRFDAELQSLGIKDRVQFAGHASSIDSALKNGDLTCVLSTCNDAVLGYGSIEVASHGFPIFFFNLGKQSHEEVLAATGGAMSVHSDPEEVAAEVLPILRLPDALKELGGRLRQYVFKTYDMKHHIPILEREIESVVSSNIQ